MTTDWLQKAGSRDISTLKPYVPTDFRLWNATPSPTITLSNPQASTLALTAGGGIRKPVQTIPAQTGLQNIPGVGIGAGYYPKQTTGLTGEQTGLNLPETPSGKYSLDTFRTAYFKKQGWTDYGRTMGPGSPDYSQFVEDLNRHGVKVTSELLNTINQHEQEVEKVYEDKYGFNARAQSNISGATSMVLPAFSKWINPEKPKIDWTDIVWDAVTLGSLGLGSVPVGLARTSLGLALNLAGEVALSKMMKDNPNPLTAIFLVLGAAGAGLEAKAVAKKLTPYVKQAGKNYFEGAVKGWDTGVSTPKIKTEAMTTKLPGGGEVPKVETPPIKPPEPPKTNINPVPPEKPTGNVVDRFVQSINDPQNLRIVEADKRLKTQQIGQRFSGFEKIMADNPNLTVEEAANRATSALKGQLSRERIKLGDLFTTEERAALVDKVSQAFPDKSDPEFLSHLQALVKALDEGVISDIKGIKGGSQRTRLEDVFGKPFVDALTNAKGKLAQNPTPVDFLEFPSGRSYGTPQLGEQPPPYKLEKPPIPTSETDLLKIELAKEYTPVSSVNYPKQMIFTETNPLGLDVELLSPAGRNMYDRLTTLELTTNKTARQISEETELLKIMLANKPTNINWVNFPDGSVGKQLSMLTPTARERTLSILKKIGVNATDALNLPRAFITSFDVSAAGRQGLQLALAHPVSATRNFAKMFKSLVSGKATKEYDEAVKSILYRAGERARKLYITPQEIKGGLGGLSQAEESFMSRLAQKIPGVKQSQRAYVTFLNLMRADVFEQGMIQLEKMGGTLKDYDALSNLINSASGRGTLPKAWQNAAPILNAVLFSPRFAISRPEYFVRLAQAFKTGNPVLMKEATKQLVTFLGFGASVIGLYKVFGGKVETDPRSAEFGKVRIGDTRVDVWAGYLQYIRTLARLTTGTTKTTSGNINPQNQWETTMQFLQSKESPALGLIVDVLRGESYGGGEMALNTGSIATQAYNRLTPLAIQDLVDAVREEGLLQGTATGTLSALGVGVVTYTDELSRLKNTQSQKIYGAQYDKLNSKSKIFIDSLPDVKKAIDKQQTQYSKTQAGKQDIYLKYRNQTKSTEQQYLKDINTASAEFKATKNGVKFRERVNTAATVRRKAYDAMNLNPDYNIITTRMSQPLTPEAAAGMQPEDVARIQYNKMMYGTDMYDQYGDYKFDLAEDKKVQFIKQYGQDALTYIEDYNGVKEQDMPTEYKALKEAQKIMRDYWQVEDAVWSMYPSELRQLSDEIDVLSRTDPAKAKAILKQFPQILRAQELVLTIHKNMRKQNPTINAIYNIFYKGG